MPALQMEEKVRNAFNKLCGTKAEKAILGFRKSGPSHEFDIYEKKKVIGGIGTSPWFNKPKGNKRPTGNTSGQDRAATELLWLALWQGPERRVHILTDKDMAERLFKKFSGACFPRSVEIHHFDIPKNIFRHIGTL